MAENKASDLYLTFGEYPTLRINNQLHRLENLPIMTDENLNEIKEKLVKPDRAEYFTKNLSIDL